MWFIFDQRKQCPELWMLKCDLCFPFWAASAKKTPCHYANPVECTPSHLHFNYLVQDLAPCRIWYWYQGKLYFSCAIRNHKTGSDTKPKYLKSWWSSMWAFFCQDHLSIKVLSINVLIPELLLPGVIIDTWTILSICVWLRSLVRSVIPEKGALKQMMVMWFILWSMMITRKPQEPLS